MLGLGEPFRRKCSSLPVTLPGRGLPHFFVRNASALPSGCDIRWAQLEGWQLDLGRRVWRRKQDSRRGGQAAGFPAGPPLPPEGGAWPLPPSGAVWSAGHAIPAMQAPGLPSLSCCRCPSLALGPCPCGEPSFQSLSPGSCQAGRGHLGPPHGRLSHVPARWLWAPLTRRPPVLRPLSFRVTCYMDGMTWRLQVALCSGLLPSPEPAFLPGSHGTCSRLLINGEGRGSLLSENELFQGEHGGICVFSWRFL